MKHLFKVGRRDGQRLPKSLVVGRLANRRRGPKQGPDSFLVIDMVILHSFEGAIYVPTLTMEAREDTIFFISYVKRKGLREVSLSSGAGLYDLV